MPIAPLWIWLIIAFAGALGLALAVIGWRGRIDDHPLCRRCGYDLHALAERRQCPECGRNLSRRRAVRLGQRRKRRLALGLGVALLTISVGGGGVIGWGTAKDFNFNPYKPLSMLRREAAAVALNPQKAAAAQTEILARLNEGRLSQSQIDGIITEALNAQADLSAAWHVWWGDFIEQAWLRRDVSNDVAIRYVKQAVARGLSLRAPPKVRGENVHMGLDARSGASRTGRIGTFAIEWHRGPVVLEDGTQLLRAYSGFGPRQLISTVEPPSSGVVLAHVTPGVHTVIVPFDLRAGLASQWPVEWYPAGMPKRKPDHVPSDAEVLAIWNVQLQANFEVVPDNEEIVERVQDPSLVEQIKRNVTIDRCAVKQPEDGREPALLECRLQMRNLPMDMAFEVLIRAAGRESAVSDVSFDTVSGESRMGPHGYLRNEPRFWRRSFHPAKPPVVGFPRDVERVDIVLRTSTQLAEACQLLRVWDGEVVIENVPLERGPLPSIRDDLEVSLFRNGEDIVCAIHRQQTGIYLVFDVLIRVGEVTTPIGSVELRPDSNSQRPLRSRWPWLPGMDRADVILRPNPQMPEATVKVFQIWGGEIVFEDVPIEQE